MSLAFVDIIFSILFDTNLPHNENFEIYRPYVHDHNLMQPINGTTRTIQDGSSSLLPHIYTQLGHNSHACTDVPRIGKNKEYY